jgi:hypothetical protein
LIDQQKADQASRKRKDQDGKESKETSAAKRPQHESEGGSGSRDRMAAASVVGFPNHLQLLRMVEYELGIMMREKAFVAERSDVHVNIILMRELNPFLAGTTDVEPTPITLTIDDLKKLPDPNYYRELKQIGPFTPSELSELKIGDIILGKGTVESNTWWRGEVAGKDPGWIRLNWIDWPDASIEFRWFNINESLSILAKPDTFLPFTPRNKRLLDRLTRNQSTIVLNHPLLPFDARPPAQPEVIEVV